MVFLLLLAVLWLLFIVKIARLAEREGNDSLTREQVAELPREGDYLSPFCGWALR